MCLAIPGQVVEIYEQDAISRIGKVNFDGIVKEVNLTYVPEVKIGDYVTVHVGFALSIVDAKEAMETIDYMREISQRNERQLYEVRKRISKS
jgi:hydrogenase expression/formation protein HypC